MEIVKLLLMIILGKLSIFFLCVGIVYLRLSIIDYYKIKILCIGQVVYNYDTCGIDSNCNTYNKEMWTTCWMLYTNTLWIVLTLLWICMLFMATVITTNAQKGTLLSICRNYCTLYNK